MKRYLPLLFFLVLVIFLYIGLSLDTKKLPSPLIGKSFPNLIVKDLSGKNISSADMLGNQLSLVNVWASWCVTCLAEHPDLLTIAKEYDVKMIGINYKDRLTDAKTFLKHYGNPYDGIIFDDQGKLGLELGVYATPETFIVNENGIIVAKFIGAISPKLIKTTLKTLKK